MVAAQDDTADLTWTPVAGADGYRVHQRDVTGGQTHFARHRALVTGRTFRARLLIPGHRYEFAVAAVGPDGDGPAGSPVAVTPHSSTPAGDVIGSAGSPGAIAGMYLVCLREDAVPVEHVERFGRLLSVQHGGVYDCGLPNTLHGFTVAATEAQAIDLAAHPDVDLVEQNHTVTLD